MLVLLFYGGALLAHAAGPRVPLLARGGRRYGINHRHRTHASTVNQLLLLLRRRRGGVEVFIFVIIIIRRGVRVCLAVRGIIQMMRSRDVMQSHELNVCASRERLSSRGASDGI